MTHIPDKEAYGFFDSYYFGVSAFIRSIVKKEWIAEDLTQETFIRAYKRLPFFHSIPQ
jgi:DNA-directed RNA polymerase specialized sigma24 family protein